MAQNSSSILCPVFQTHSKLDQNDDVSNCHRNHPSEDTSINLEQSLASQRFCLLNILDKVAQAQKLFLVLKLKAVTFKSLDNVLQTLVGSFK